MNIAIPELSMVVLIGVSGSGKSTFARKHFASTEILSSDYFRGMVSDNENDLAATNDAFDVLHYVAAKRLAAGKLVVIDATNVQTESRKPLIELARTYHCLPVAIVLDLPAGLCEDRNRERPDRQFASHVIRNQQRNLRQSQRFLGKEGFRHVFVLKEQETVDAVEVVREPLYNNRRSETGPFDIIGDIHGCFDELQSLLTRLGYAIETSDSGVTVTPPEGRRAVFLGDLGDRGPHTPDVLRLVMSMVEAGTGLCVPGNHDMKLLRKLRGEEVRVSHGLALTLEQLAGEPPEFSKRAAAFLDALISHYVFDGGRLVVAHAGLKQEMQGRGSGKVREFALYGDTTGERDELGLPVRNNWAADYRGDSMVVYGHTPVPQPEWLNRTINIDTGCVFGGALTALRYPERELVSEPAKMVYSVPLRPFLPDESEAPAMSAQLQNDDLLEIEDVNGKRQINTRLSRNITIREENAIAALEIMSRFAANPKWLIYLPPTMSPSETTSVEGLLEHPSEAFAYYRQQGIPMVVCQEKHMGSRAVVIVCRDESVARSRFGVKDQGIGICVTRTGRRFFDNAQYETELLDTIRKSVHACGMWEALTTDWICLDCELMPWSAKARELLKQQYAAVGAAAMASMPAAVAALKGASERTAGMEALVERYSQRGSLAEMFVNAYRRYCWPVDSISDLRLAPFHILATETGAHVDKNHLWHMEQIARICAAGDGLLMATPYKSIDVTDAESIDTGIAWWEVLTEQGGEGMVVKPLDFIARGSKGLVQPAVKCRGREYLRIIYGPEYTMPENLVRLRSRGLTGKRSLALREFALGVEGLERFARREPLRRVHECVFGVLALESEPVDPRL